MRSQPYRLILILLIVCVLSVITVQAFWMRSLYEQKRDGFATTVYSAMEQVAQKLNDRRNLRSLRQHVILKGEKGQRKLIEKRIQRLEIGRNYRLINAVDEKKKIHFDSLHRHVLVDSIIIERDQPDLAIKDPSLPIEPKELDLLLEKMITEVHQIDIESGGGDSIEAVIRKVLNNKGIFVPFEYAVKKESKGVDSILTASAGFDPHGQAYESDLSAGTVFRTGKYLLIQFPGLFPVLMKGMQGMLLLSLLFSLLIIFAAFYSYHLIMKQKRISEMKADFVNNMTHELKTPIATISLAVDSLGRPEVKDNEARFNEYRRILKEENDKLNSHVERVLQMSQLDRKSLKVECGPVDVLPIIESSRRSFQLRIEEQRSSVKVVCDEASLQAVADPDHLLNVLNNLFDNAIKYCPAGCQVTVHAQKVNEQVLISVKDNGPGIPPEHQQKVFEKFYRVHGGDLHEVKGFGLGLSYVRSVLDAMGGSIELRSEKNKGSEFIIRLKAA